MRAPSRSLLALSLLTVVSLASGLAQARDLQCPTDFHVPIVVSLTPPNPCSGDSVFAVFHACFPCQTLIGVSNTDSGVVVQSSISNPLSCLSVLCIPESLTYSLGRLAAGHFQFNFKYLTQLTVRDTSGDSLVCLITNSDSLGFDVAKTCGPTPPPGPLPFVSAVHIGSPGPCDSCPPVACPGESIQVVIQGAFDSSCLHFSGLEMVLPLAARTDIPIPGPIPAPPMIRLIYDRLTCPESTCAVGTFPWSTHVTLPPLPSRSTPPYQLAISAVQREVNCSGPTDSITMLGATTFPFTVAPSCSVVVAPRCLRARFDVAGGSGDRCDAFISPGHTTAVKFLAGSGVSLFGLQGDFKFSPPKLRVANIQAIGPAAGMHLQWQNTDHGAKFVLFSEGTAHIPPIDSALAAVLEIDVAPGTEDSGPGKSGDKGSPPRIRMDVENLLGADGSAHAVLPCPTFAEDMASFVEFCRGSGCDFNGDGSVDVRDLVAMILCMHDSTSCPPGATPPDCNGNGVFDLPDVMCCADEILHGEHPHKKGDEHEDRSLSLSFGTPVSRGGGLVEIPVTLNGDHPIGGARLTFNFPGDRYEVRDVVFPSNPSCLGLYASGRGNIDVGLLELGGSADRVKSHGGSANLTGTGQAGAAYHSFSILLALKPGQTAGGDVSLSLADISDPTGSMIGAALGTPIASLGGGGNLQLAPARPNPFGRTMTFAVILSKAAADLDVSIHDVSGREVMTLHHGAMTAGSHSFIWDGTRSDGTRAANGIYFYRARANGQTVSSKVVLIREE